VIVLLGAMAIFAAISLMFRSTSATATSSQTVAGFATASAALEQFASTAARLPCPADPSADTGDAVPPGPNPTCTFPAGTIPWRTIGMSREDALDAWGWKIGYRVYTGNAGSLTQAEGASLVHCDTNPVLPAGKTPLVGNSGGTCRPTHNTRHTDFLDGKGLTVTDFGTAHSDVAYVLVSFGPSGNGGYTSAGLQKQPVPTNADESANTTATGPFVARASTTTGLQPASVNFFDDVLFYRKLTDFVKGANLSARDWPELTVTSNIVLNAATVGAAVGDSVSFGDNLRATSIDLGSARISGFRSGNRTTNLSFEEGANGTSGDGIGGIGINRTNTLISSAGAEFVRIDFDDKVEFRFYDGGTLVGSPILKGGCNADGGLASFSLDPGGAYDSVDIIPLSATAAGGYTSTSALLISAFAACAAGPGLCHTPLEIANPTSTCP
jgi:hypothetical protein